MLPTDKEPPDKDVFDLNGRVTESEATTEGSWEYPLQSPSAELLRYHHKFGHISFRRLQEMAKSGVLPARLADCPIPLCGSCLYGKATKWAKGTKTPVAILPQIPVRAPGDCISVDCLTSGTPGLIAQLSGRLTNQRYMHVCIFVDHYSDLGYVHLLKSQSGNELMEAKEAFEAYADSLGVQIRHYHVDNGIFNAKVWRQSCSNLHQGLTYAGVNAHHQNGIAERRVRSLQDMARTMLIHVNHHWLAAISS